jgi:hypothetical protein
MRRLTELRGTVRLPDVLHRRLHRREVERIHQRMPDCSLLLQVVPSFLDFV